MADTIFGSGNDQWVCPNDRQLALRAKLQTGWSVHTYQTEKQRRNQHLSPAEVEAILQVIQRAERLDYILPLKTPGRADDPHVRPVPLEPAEREPRSSETGRIYTWARGRVVSSDSDSDSDLSSSSLEDRLPPAGVRGPKGNKPWRESGGTVETPRMGLTHPPGHLSGSQSSLASEMGTDSADPQRGPLPQVKDTPGRAPSADAAPAGPSGCLG
uniref:RabBD domain-containing protein n=1 Tax=Colobus angolensis palliatus TaxID=336983 RepID=A0A2K5ITU9_COLAP